MNDGLGGDVYSEIDSVAIRDKPHYREHTTTQASVPGNRYFFKVAAFNTNGVTYSEAVGFTLGLIPPTPQNPPTSITLLSSSKMLGISIEEVTVSTSTTPAILSYSIEIDDG